ncbi:MAG: galactose-1-phosphate uridylyltransferase [Candidatus Bathyarchaeota archaeon]|nr:MAG: galactose-1-phosphate uridylyltransferase [Candidatus Bathyarchaeota archaeon]
MMAYLRRRERKVKRRHQVKTVAGCCGLLNDLRKDYLLNRWVVIATHRKRRPTDFTNKRSAPQSVDGSKCPFCPGNERKTPPAVLLYLKGEKGRILKEKDTDGFRHENWLIRCVSNLYPAFSPPENGQNLNSGRAVGHHEVLVESPNHTEHPAVARLDQLTHVVNAYIDRLKELSAKPYVRYVSIFRNHGLEAGASLSHAHSQIIATPTTPVILSNELRASKDFHEANGLCVFCNILEKEKMSARFIWEDENFVAFAPRAAVHPFEFWILPKAHRATLLDLPPKSTKSLTRALSVCLGGLNSLLNDPPYNYGFHIAPNNGERNEFYHWHLEVYPKLTIWAGFEKSTGIYINVVPPEDSAKSLKIAIEKSQT